MWVPLVGLAIVMIRFTTLAAGPIKDPDAWWHLRVGREFWSGNWSLHDTGPLSSFATEEWTPRDWVPQLVASRFELWFGLPGVAWLYGLSLLAFLMTAYLVCRRFADPMPATLATVLGGLGATGSLSQRPQVISFILMLIVVSAWLATTRDLKPRWWLIPLTWVWASSHGMWYCGIAVGILVVAGLAIDRRVNLRHALTLACVPALSLLAAGATPVGPRLWLTLFDTTGMWRFVSEWQSPSFRDLAPAITVLMIFIVVAIWARLGVRMPWTHIGVLALGAGWTLLSARTVALGAVTVAPLVATALQSLQQNRPPVHVRRAEPLFLGLVTLGCLAALALAVPATSDIPGDVPNGLDDQLASLPAGTAVLNEYVLGGWLHWRHPELQTVVDGFTDGYTTDAVSDYGEALTVSAGWQTYLEDTGADVALLREDSPLAVALTDRLGWTNEGQDAGYVLLTASN